MPVVLVGTLDTKGEELGFVHDLVRAAGLDAIVIDAGSLGPPAFPAHIDRERVFFRAGVDLDALRDRGEAVAAAAEGVASLVVELQGRGQVDGILALGGGAGTTIGTAAMRALPFGVPKVMVSTLASGQTRPFVGGSDIALFHSVVDIAGLNRPLRTVLANAAHALIGMVRHRVTIGPASDWQAVAHRDFEIQYVDDPAVRLGDGPVVAATMFGVTTPCVTRARKALAALGCEVLVFHATGVGGQAMEGLIRDGRVDAVLDLTTTEMADEVVGGVLSAGPDRLKAAVARGLPQVVSLGALDMVNFGPKNTVPERFAGRLFHVHNANVTLMRTTPAENAEIGRRVADALAGATAPMVVMIPMGGVSALDVPGGPFWDPEADAALFDAIRGGLDGHPWVRIVERPEAINDPAFADEAARELIRALRDDRPGLAAARIATTWASPDQLDELGDFLEEQGLPTIGVSSHLDGYALLRGADGRLVGSAGLERHGADGLLRSVAVAPDLRGYGLGTRLVATMLNRAAADGIERLYLATDGSPDFFRRHGFVPIPGEALPAAIASNELFRSGHCASATAMCRSLVNTGQTT